VDLLVAHQQLVVGRLRPHEDERAERGRTGAGRDGPADPDPVVAATADPTTRRVAAACAQNRRAVSERR
jgi:hypothetical protein